MDRYRQLAFLVELNVRLDETLTEFARGDGARRLFPALNVDDFGPSGDYRRGSGPGARYQDGLARAMKAERARRANVIRSRRVKDALKRGILVGGAVAGVGTAAAIWHRLKNRKNRRTAEERKLGLVA